MKESYTGLVGQFLGVLTVSLRFYFKSVCSVNFHLY